MLRKIATISLFATTLWATASAQGRDFRKEKEELYKEERLERSRYREKRPVQYNSNILNVSPITAMDIGVGLGMSYEHIFGKSGMIGLILPVSYIMEDRGAGYFTGDMDVSSNHRYVYFTPGLKIYPFGQRRVTYAVGPSLMFGYGGGKEWRYYQTWPTGASSIQTNVTRFRFGMLVNNYVNFQITPLFNIGLNAGVGARYLDQQTESNPILGKSTHNYPMNITGQASVTLGFRF